MGLYEYDAATSEMLEDVIEHKVRAVLMRGSEWRWVERDTFEITGQLFRFVDGEDDIPMCTIHGRVRDLVAVKQLI